MGTWLAAARWFAWKTRSTIRRAIDNPAAYGGGDESRIVLTEAPKDIVSESRDAYASGPSQWKTKSPRFPWSAGGIAALSRKTAIRLEKLLGSRRPRALPHATARRKWYSHNSITRIAACLWDGRIMLPRKKYPPFLRPRKIAFGWRIPVARRPSHWHGTEATFTEKRPAPKGARGGKSVRRWKQVRRLCWTSRTVRREFVLKSGGLLPSLRGRIRGWGWSSSKQNGAG